MPSNTVNQMRAITNFDNYAGDNTFPHTQVQSNLESPVYKPPTESRLRYSNQSKKSNKLHLKSSLGEQSRDSIVSKQGIVNGLRGLYNDGDPYADREDSSSKQYLRTGPRMNSVLESRKPLAIPSLGQLRTQGSNDRL